MIKEIHFNAKNVFLINDAGTNDYLEENKILKNITPTSFAIHRNKFHSST